MSVKDIEGRVEVKERITIRKRGQITGEQEAEEDIKAGHTKRFDNVHKTLKKP